MPKKALNLREDSEIAIRRGDAAAARALLRAVPARTWAREDLAEVANLAWRSSVPALGIRLLNRLVRPSGKSPENATPAEVGEYAMCLAKLGSSEEALILLREIPSGAFSYRDYYCALVLMGQWQYAEARALLESHLTDGQLDTYRRTVAEINLAACHLESGHECEGAVLLQRLLSDTRRRELPLLRANALELTAQSAITQRDWPLARRALEEAKALLADRASLDAFLVHKWERLLEYHQSPRRETLGVLRAEARERGHWETARHCDRIEAIDFRDQTLARHVYLGTPFPAFRDRFAADAAGLFSFPVEYVWCPRWNLSAESVPIDLLSGPPTPDSLPHRALTALCADFYRPCRLLTLFSRLYPGEHYNPQSSPGRTQQAIRVLREWLRQRKIALTVRVADGAAVLGAGGAIGVRLGTAPVASPLGKLRAHFGRESFTARQASLVLSVSGRTALRWLADAVDEGELIREGKRRAARYRMRG